MCTRCTLIVKFVELWSGTLQPQVKYTSAANATGKFIDTDFVYIWSARWRLRDAHMCNGRPVILYFSMFVGFLFFLVRFCTKLFKRSQETLNVHGDNARAMYADEITICIVLEWCVCVNCSRYQKYKANTRFLYENNFISFHSMTNEALTTLIIENGIKIS